jgi:hypothetical protein
VDGEIKKVGVPQPALVPARALTEMQAFAYYRSLVLPNSDSLLPAPPSRANSHGFAEAAGLLKSLVADLHGDSSGVDEYS